MAVVVVLALAAVGSVVAPSYASAQGVAFYPGSQLLTTMTQALRQPEAQRSEAAIEAFSEGQSAGSSASFVGLTAALFRDGDSPSALAAKLQGGLVDGLQAVSARGVQLDIPGITKLNPVVFTNDFRAAASPRAIW